MNRPNYFKPWSTVCKPVSEKDDAAAWQGGKPSTDDIVRAMRSKLVKG